MVFQQGGNVLVPVLDDIFYLVVEVCYTYIKKTLSVVAETFYSLFSFLLAVKKISFIFDCVPPFLNDFGILSFNLTVGVFLKFVFIQVEIFFDTPFVLGLNFLVFGDVTLADCVVGGQQKFIDVCLPVLKVDFTHLWNIFRLEIVRVCSLINLRLI